MSGERDLLIDRPSDEEEPDLAFGPDGEPRLRQDAAVIAQDIKHRLLESGLGPELLADDEDSSAVLARIAFEVEEDQRIRSGSARVERGLFGSFIVRAETLEGAVIEQTVTP